MSDLKKISLNSKDNDHFVYIDKSSIKAVQVQLPVNVGGLVAVQGEGSIGIVRVFLVHMSAPFQFTRDTREEVEELVKQITE